MKRPTLNTNTMALKRWRSRLKRAMTMIDKLEKQRRRLEKTPAHWDVDPVRKGELVVTEAILAQSPLTPKPVSSMLPLVTEIDTSIPAFLQRKPLDPVAAGIKAEQEETKKKKTAGRIAKMKAKASGEMRKMPLSGRDALTAIFGSD